MRLNITEEKTVELSTLSPGETFIYKRDYYLALDETCDNGKRRLCAQLHSGSIYRLYSDQSVIPFDLVACEYKEEPENET